MDKRVGGMHTPRNKNDPH